MHFIAIEKSRTKFTVRLCNLANKAQRLWSMRIFDRTQTGTEIGYLACAVELNLV